MPSVNPKRKQAEAGWVEPRDLGVMPPEIKLYDDATLTTEIKSANFDLVDRGTTGEKTVYIHNASNWPVFNLSLQARPEPDEDWLKRKNAVGPMHLELEPQEIPKLGPKETVPLKLTWRVAEDEPWTPRRASIYGEGRMVAQ